MGGAAAKGHRGGGASGRDQSPGNAPGGPNFQGASGSDRAGGDERVSGVLSGNGSDLTCGDHRVPGAESGGRDRSLAASGAAQRPRAGLVTSEHVLAQIHGRTTFVVGDRKGTGKTTFLKYAHAKLRGWSSGANFGPSDGAAAASGARPAHAVATTRPEFPGDTLADPVTAPRSDLPADTPAAAFEAIGLMSVGVDGEAMDQIHGTAKPRIDLEPGDVALTSEGALKASDAGFEVLDILPASGPFGRSLVVRCLRPGRIELHSPGSNAACRRGIAALEAHTSTLLVDGAVNRVTQLSGVLDGGLVFVASYDASTASRAFRILDRMVLLAGLEPADAQPSPSDTVVGGALTDDGWASLPETGRVVVEDFTRVFLSDHVLVRVRHRLAVRRAFPFRALVINSPAHRPEEWAHTCPIPVMWNPYEVA